MPESRVNLRNPWLAALLAYAIPGAGHLYQRRFFKAALYCVCILGTLAYGMHLGEWRVVYIPRDSKDNTYGYLAQILVGLPALPAVMQARRYHSPARDPISSLEEPLSAPFTGILREPGEDNQFRETEVSGQIQLEPTAGEFGRSEVRGRFTGQMEGEGEVELLLGGNFEMHAELRADPRRDLAVDVLSDERTRNAVAGLEGSIPRDFVDWFEVPLDNELLQDLNGRLGKRWELAKLFTWIAGLLNILAIWDALEGPAYGYGDEEESSESKRKKQNGAKPRNGENGGNQPPAGGKQFAEAAGSREAGRSTTKGEN